MCVRVDRQSVHILSAVNLVHILTCNNKFNYRKITNVCFRIVWQQMWFCMAKCYGFCAWQHNTAKCMAYCTHICKCRSLNLELLELNESQIDIPCSAGMNQCFMAWRFLHILYAYAMHVKLSQKSFYTCIVLNALAQQQTLIPNPFFDPNNFIKI